jgi:uncharacterized FAD-dependent dehydrogenase
MLRLENIKIREDLSDEDVVREACRKYQISFSDVEYYNIFKKSIDARNKDDIFYNYTIDVKYTGKGGKEIKKVTKESNLRTGKKARSSSKIKENHGNLLGNF